MEAVLVPDGAGVVCAKPSKGGDYLDGAVAPQSKEKRYLHPHMIDSETVCAQERSAPGADKRVLDRGFIKDLVRESIEKKEKKIDPIGIRILGGIYCDGLDLVGLDIPYSLVLDRSIFRGRVDIRNFRTKGDLSVDNAIVYTSLLINRVEISGSIWAQYAFIRKIEIADATIKGAIRLDHTVILDRLIVQNVSVTGDLEIATSFFSHLEIFRNNIGGALDLSQSQARCSYDIRKNEIGDMVAVQLGFGEAQSSETTNASETNYYFKRVSDNENFGRAPSNSSKNRNDGYRDPYDRYTETNSRTGEMIRAAKECAFLRSIKPGTFVFVGNRVKSSLCVRSFNWLSDKDDRTLKSNIYLNENVIVGATWLDVTQTEKIENEKSEAGYEESIIPIFTILNVGTGTLVLNFDLATQDQDLSLTVNGLQFERIYTSNARCESALALRSGKPKQPGARDLQKELAFPPKLELPKTEQIIAWINKNEFANTQQPFAEFVKVFEKAGDSEGAKELKIRAANAALESSLCGLAPSSWLARVGLCAVHAAGSTREEGPASKPSMFDEGIRWVEKTVVAVFKLMLWGLAEHGYRPERIGWFVLGTVLLLWVLSPFAFGVVGYSVEGNPEKIEPISLVFLFDRLLPAYKIREQNYKIKRFYVVPEKSSDRETIRVRRFFKQWRVAEATDQENARVERRLDFLRFLGLVFTIFIIAAIGNLVR